MRKHVLVGLSIVAACSLAAPPTPRELVARARKGPSLLLTRDMLPEIRRKAEVDPDAKAWWNTVRKNADRALARPEAIPDRGGQWTLWYTCRGCGVMLKAESPTRHVCPKCGKAYSGWPFDDVYVSRVHSRLSRAARDCGLMWLLTGEAKYATRVKEILLGYAAAYDGYVWHSRNGPVDRPNKNGAARAAAQILDEAAWLIPILQGIDAVRDTLTPEDDARIISGLVKPSTETIRTECAKWSNHECWHLAAYGLSGLVQRDEALVDAALHSRYGAFNQLEHGILPDGCWYEGALHYHFYTMDAFTPFFQALRNLGMEPPRAYKRMFDAPFGQLAPDGQLPPVNDSWPTWFRPGDRAEHYELAYAWWGDPLYGWWVAQRPRRTMQYALWGRSGGKSDAAPLSLASRLYEASGIAVLRTQTPGRSRAGITPDNCLMMDFGPHGEWHGHPDKLNIFFWLHGQLVSEDPGCIGYGNPRHWGWYKSTLAHDTLRIDGENQGNATGTLLGFGAASNAAVVAAVVSGARPKSRWDGPVASGVGIGRATALVDDVIFDCLWVDSADEHQYEWCFHARGTCETSVAAAPIVDLPPHVEKIETYKGTNWKGDDSWSWVESPAKGVHAGSWRAKWKQPGVTLNVFHWSPPGELWTGRGSAQPPTERLSLAVNRVRCRSVAFPTVMTTDGVTDVSFDEAICDSDGTRGFAATVNGRKFLFLVNPKGTSCRGRDGCVMLLERTDGDLTMVISAQPSAQLMLY